MRRSAQWLRRQLKEEQKAAGKWWENAKMATRRSEEINAKTEEADAASMSLGFAFKDSRRKWQLVNPDSSNSFFEEALCFYLREIGLTEADVTQITTKPARRRPADGGSGGDGGG